MTDNITKMVGQTRLSGFFFSLLYSTPANSAESQLLEALPASHYGHWKNLLIRESADLGFAANSHFDILKIHLKEYAPLGEMSIISNVRSY